MRFTDIVYRKADGIAWLTINRPEVYNAVRSKTSDEMVEALQDAAADASIRAVVINGAGPNAFSSGQDQGQERMMAGLRGDK
jgi:enoyl-CoA hydratase/carnithine racemase